MKSLALVLVTFTSLLCLLGCVSVARVSDMPKASTAFNFDDLAKRSYDLKDPIWNQKTESSHFIETGALTEDELISKIRRALASLSYHARITDKDNKAIIAERSMRANEWASVAGVYYRPKENGFQVYIIVRITQDITGGWRENRAKKIACSLCAELEVCKPPCT